MALHDLRDPESTHGTAGMVVLSERLDAWIPIKNLAIRLIRRRGCRSSCEPQAVVSTSAKEKFIRWHLQIAEMDKMQRPPCNPGGNGVTPALIEIRNISKKFGDFYANRDISLDILEGEIHAIVGENGAGKSTLMNLLFGQMRPDSRLNQASGEIQSCFNILGMQSVPESGWSIKISCSFPSSPCLKTSLSAASRRGGTPGKRQGGRAYSGQLGPGKNCSASRISSGFILTRTGLQTNSNSRSGSRSHCFGYCTAEPKSSSSTNQPVCSHRWKRRSSSKYLNPFEPGDAPWFSLATG